MVSCFQSGLQRFLAPSEWPAALSLSLSLSPSEAGPCVERRAERDGLPGRAGHRGSGRDELRERMRGRMKKLFFSTGLDRHTHTHNHTQRY